MKKSDLCRAVAQIPFPVVLKRFLINLRLAPGNAKTRPSGSNTWHCYSSASPSFMNIKRFNERLKGIEDPCSKLQGIFDRKEVYHFQIRSLTPQLAAGLALAFSVHVWATDRMLPDA